MTDLEARTYTSEELAKILNVNIRYVRDNARTKTWPSLTFGKRTIRFTEEHIQTILTTSETPASATTTRRRRRTA